jgi:hypothetical protein
MQLSHAAVTYNGVRFGKEFALKTDITTKQLYRQLNALSWPTFEFGIKARDTQSMIRRTWTLETVLDSIAWLKRSNASHHHIYLRPNDQNPYVLLDDIGPNQLFDMKADGIEAACVISTSRMNYQAWIKVGKEPLENSLKTALGGLLAERYGGDLASKDWRHLGRAVGFTNVKHKYQRKDGLYPYVTLVSSSGAITPNYQALIKEARLMTQDSADTRQKKLIRARPSVHTPVNATPSINADRAFQNGVNYITWQYGTNTDPSRADVCSALWMYRQGFDINQIESAIANNMSVQHRKRGHVSDYAKRTALYAKRASTT